jgi:hypothetical protein
VRLIEGWQRVLPDWKVVAWTNEDLDWSSRYVNQAYATRGWTRLADYMRVYALYHHGGFYLDTDVELLKSLDPLRGHDVVLGFQSTARIPSWVNNAVIGARPRHPFVARWLRAFQERMPGWRRMGDAHGPGLLTRLLEEEGLDGERADATRLVGEVTLLPPEYFYPYSWTERFSPECVTPHTLAVHHWSGTDARFRPLSLLESLRALAACAAPRLTATLLRHRLAWQAGGAAREQPAISPS